MDDTARLGPWVRRFLLEHLIGERNLSVNTQRSYRDTLALLIPFAARQIHKKVDELTVLDVSEKCVAGFLVDLEEVRGCSTSTRNQRLAAIHALSHFVAIAARSISRGASKFAQSPSKSAPRGLLRTWKSQRWTLCSPRPISRLLKVGAIISSCYSFTIPARAQTRPRNSSSPTWTWLRCPAGTSPRSKSEVRAIKSVAVPFGPRRSRN
jgi:hypothetical protein